MSEVLHCLRVRTISAYDIYPSHENPVFTPLKKLTNFDLLLDASSDITACRFSKNRLASLMGRTVIIWDFVEGTIAAWKIETSSGYAHVGPERNDQPPKTYQTTSQIAITDHWLFLFKDDAQFSRWKIPELVPVANFTLGHIVAQIREPDETCTMSSPWLLTKRRHDIRAAGLSVIRTSSRPFRLVYITEYHDEAFLHHFDLEKPCHPSKTPLKLKFLGEAETREAPRHGYYHGQFCGDAFVLPFLTMHNKIMLTVSKGFDSPRSHKSKVVRLWEAPARAYTRVLDFDYCPVAARFCVSTNGGEIRILDF
jgi:hypothetical protein